MEQFEYLEESRFNCVKETLMQMRNAGMAIDKMVACVHDLWQEYIISDTQENILYEIADPEEKYNDCWEYWCSMDYPNPLMEVIR